MQLLYSVSELRSRLANEKDIAFVPTMGNLHEGHINLVRIAREKRQLRCCQHFRQPDTVRPQRRL